MSQTLFEKLELGDDKNVLIQGLPSNIEKQFSKISFSKNVTPLLRNRKIDFALVFVLNANHLKTILNDVCPALHEETKLWVASPKETSKIVTDLNRESSWECMAERGLEAGDVVVLDYVWSAQRYHVVTDEEESSKVVNLKSDSKLAKAEGF